MPGHIKGFDDYQVVEGTDIVYILKSNIGTKINPKTRYIENLKKKAGWITTTQERTETGKDMFGWAFYRAYQGKNIWEELEKGDAIHIGDFEEDSHPPRLDSNDNILLRSAHRDLREMDGGNVLLNREGRVIVDLEGYGIIRPDVDGYGNYFADIYKTRSSGGRPVTDKRNYAFFTPTGERIGGKDKSFEYSETPTIHVAKSKYTVAGVSPYYIYDMGKNNPGRPEAFPNLAELIIANSYSDVPFIENPATYLDKLFDRQKSAINAITKLNKKLDSGSISQAEYEEMYTSLTNELEATDIALKIIEKGIASGLYEEPTQ